jgi:hypothetical protein
MGWSFKADRPPLPEGPPTLAGGPRKVQSEDQPSFGFVVRPVESPKISSLQGKTGFGQATLQPLACGCASGLTGEPLRIDAVLTPRATGTRRILSSSAPRSRINKRAER